MQKYGLRAGIHLTIVHQLQSRALTCGIHSAHEEGVQCGMLCLRQERLQWRLALPQLHSECFQGSYRHDSLLQAQQVSCWGITTAVPFK